MSMRRKLFITSTDFNESDEDYYEDDVEAHDDYETESRHTGKMQGCESNCVDSKENSYEKARRMRILENEKKMKALGITNIAKSLKSKPESQKTQQTKVKPHFIPPMYMNRVVNQVKLRQPAGSNVPHKIPLSKDNKGEKRKLVLVDEDDDEDDESFQVDHDIQDDESQEISDALQRNNQYEIEMVKCSKSKNKGICKRKRLQMVTTSTVFDERITDPVHDDLVEENQVYETQVHQTGDIQDAPKKVRGYTKKAQTWKMDSTQRIVVRFNKFGKPVGDEANELAQFLGSLVRISDHVSIEYPDWRKVPTQNKEDMYSLVKSKFVFLPNETNEIKKWILYSMGKKWRSWKGSLKARLYDPSLTVDEIVGQQVKNDKRVCQTQFKELATRWFTPKFQGKKDVWVTDFSNLGDIAI
ncbi:hypothetical protein E3N88_32031 [Mikania micrantha]|uniref:Uncharacterized protein n=1 Tax=Mikania micrantha TaxID=192012 RepID=A0A5N6M7N5_9ASTR|nr:hypothetical protein E3N88_32031 [Mikania micrantha]